MKGAIFLAAFAGLPLVGAGPILSRRFRWMPLGAAVTSAAAVGAVLLGVEMFALTVVGVRWNPWLLLLGPAALIVLARRRGRAEPRVSSPAAGPWEPWTVLFLLFAIAALVLVAYAAMTARATSSDLLLFWGAKGERFGLAGRIDDDFLGRADHQMMHPDYPPLWPSLYGFGTMLAGRFAWGASLATLPFFLALSAAAVWSFARPRLGARNASALSAAIAALFGFLLMDSVTAGNADPPLLFFEALALCLLTFAPEKRGAFFLAGIALAGATWLKLEGIAFGWAVIAASAVSIRPISRRRLAQLALPPLAAYVSWIVFCRAHGLLETLGAHPLTVTGERLRTIVSGMLAAAGMGCGYAPWILAVLLIVIRRPGRRAIFPLVVAGLVAAFDCGIYLAALGDPRVWIMLAGPRTLMTPLLAAIIAAMAPAGPAADRVPTAERPRA